MSQDELNAFLGQNFPTTAAAMETMPDALQRFEVFVGVFATDLANHAVIQPVAFVPIKWSLVIGGALMVLTGGYCVSTKQ